MDYMTALEAAHALGVPLRTIQYRLTTGEMKGERLGRAWAIPRTEVERWHGGGKIKPGRKPRTITPPPRREDV